METIWFVCVALMIAMYVLLDGFDLGAGAIHLFAARDDRERRTIIRAIGPVWDGNEVWLHRGGRHAVLRLPLALRFRASPGSTCRSSSCSGCS